MANATHALAVRLPPRIYELIKAEVSESTLSMNAIIVQALEERYNKSDSTPQDGAEYVLALDGHRSSWIGLEEKS